MSITEAENLTKITLRGRKVVGGCAEGEALVTRDTIPAGAASTNAKAQ